MEQSDREHKERRDSGTGGKTRPRKNIRPSSSGFSQYTACQSASRCTSWWWRWRGRIVPATMQYVQLQTTCASKKAKRHTPYLGYNTAESEPNPCFNEQTLLWLRTSWMRALCFSSFLDFMIRTIAAWEKNSEDIWSFYDLLAGELPAGTFSDLPPLRDVSPQPPLQNISDWEISSF